MQTVFEEAVAILAVILVSFLTNLYSSLDKVWIKVMILWNWKGKSEKAKVECSTFVGRAFNLLYTENP